MSKRKTPYGDYEVPDGPADPNKTPFRDQSQVVAKDPTPPLPVEPEQTEPEKISFLVFQALVNRYNSLQEDPPTVNEETGQPSKLVRVQIIAFKRETGAFAPNWGQWNITTTNKIGDPEDRSVSGLDLADEAGLRDDAARLEFLAYQVFAL